MAFGLNTTKAFVTKASVQLGRLGNFTVEFVVGFTEEIALNVTNPSPAGAIDLMDSQTQLPSEDLNKTVTSLVIKGLKSPHVKKQVFLLIAGATPNLI